MAYTQNCTDHGTCSKLGSRCPKSPRNAHIALQTKWARPALSMRGMRMLEVCMQYSFPRSLNTHEMQVQHTGAGTYSAGLVGTLRCSHSNTHG